MWLGSRQSVVQSVGGQQLLAVDVAVTTMLKQIEVPEFLVRVRVMVTVRVTVRVRL